MIYVYVVVSVWYVVICILAYACLRAGALADERLERWAARHKEDHNE
jgi:hypothetical protein